MRDRIAAFRGSKHFELKHVTDHVIAAIAVPGTGSLGNATIIDLGDATMVVDTFLTPQAASDLKEAYHFYYRETGNLRCEYTLAQ